MVNQTTHSSGSSRGFVRATAFLLALMVSAGAAAQELRKVVAVARFDNSTAVGSGGQYNLDSGMADQLTYALTESGAFIVLERQIVDNILAEQNLVAAGRAVQSKSARTGKLTAAQILIKGTITEFEMNASGGGQGFSYGGFKLGGSKTKAHIAIIIRLIDTTTGEVLSSRRVEGKAKAGGMNFGIDMKGIGFDTKEFKKTPLGKAVQDAITKAVSFIAAEARTIPFRAAVIRVSENDLLISAGARHGTQVGTRFAVFSMGEEIIDPLTGELLGTEETRLGMVEVLDVKERYSKAKVIDELVGAKPGDIIRSIVPTS